MSEKTAIAWTSHTFNIAWGCVKVSPGCKNCYADSQSRRYGFDVWGPSKPRRTFKEAHWKEPLKWNKEAALVGEYRTVFCSSMCDVFEDHPTITQEREKLWPLIDRTPNLIWQLLTKRPERILEAIHATVDLNLWERIRRRVWLGTSIENADYAHRAGYLRESLVLAPAATFISYEPALGPLAHALNLEGIDWLIYGGESGPDDVRRPEDKQWARDIMAKCREAGTAFFHKQSADRYTERGIKLDGKIIREYPPQRYTLPTI